ncbi:cytochrome P450 3A24-like [Tachypleus tridentatus]|uniref:cytochrome P450 3A24-like n=1 Tax=Tachypleus tridentatus TaxID=6853 RepID=UPI003FD207B3
MGIKEIENRYPYESVLYNLSKPVHEVEEERYNKYGNIYGKFEGTNPVLVMGDPDLVKLITIKDFHAFIDRRVFRVGKVYNSVSVNKANEVRARSVVIARKTEYGSVISIPKC